MNEPNEKDFSINLGHYHEVMDRAHLMENTWTREVDQLKAVINHQQLADQSAKVMDEIARFYQLAGQVYDNMENRNGNV